MTNKQRMKQEWGVITFFLVLSVIIVGCSDTPEEVNEKRANDPWIIIDERRLVTRVEGHDYAELYGTRYYDPENEHCIQFVSQGRRAGAYITPCPSSFTPPE